MGMPFYNGCRVPASTHGTCAPLPELTFWQPFYPQTMDEDRLHILFFAAEPRHAEEVDRSTT